MPKPFLSLQGQIDLLKSRGLIFDNDEIAKNYLLKNNYYNVINSNSKFFINKDENYLNGTNFNEIVAVHTFDKTIKDLLLNNILTIENYFRSIVAYCYAEKTKNEAYAYFNIDNYGNDDNESHKLIEDLNELINDENEKGDNAIKHYVNTYNDVPIWVLCNFMTFGQTLRLFKYSRNDIKSQIVHSINDCVNDNLQTSNIRLNQVQIHNILDNIKNTRNIAAHNNRLFDHRYMFNYPYVGELYSSLGITSSLNRNSIYDTIIQMKMFMEEEKFNYMNTEISKAITILTQKVKTIDVDIITSSFGFPNSK